VATNWLNRPEQRNAFTPTMRAELNAALGRFEHDDAIQAVVLTGAGRYFSAGADLSRRGPDTFWARPDEERPGGGAPPGILSPI